MTKILKSIYIYIIIILNRIIPKNKQKIVFMSFPDYSDNAKHFYEYMKRQEYGYELIWFINKEENLLELRKRGVKCYKSKSIKRFLHFFTSKYIVTTHNDLINLKCKNQVFISLWHGMPLKNIGYLENKVDKRLKKYTHKIDYSIATSKLMKYTMASVFNLDPNKVLVSGQPRTDKLREVMNKEKIQTILDLNFDNYKKIIFYVPTFKNGVGKADGVRNDKNIINILTYDEDKFNKWLKRNEFLLVAKLHPFEEIEFKENGYSNIKILKSERLAEEFLDINDILNLFDLLITDYSSVYFDFLLLERPILFTNMDEDEYIKKRGFIFDNPSFWRPGPKVSNVDELLNNIKKLINQKEFYEEERNIISSLINHYKDYDSSKRIYEDIIKIKGDIK